jgi:hypothetical protein
VNETKDPEVLALQLQRRRLLARKMAMIKECGLAFYKPFPKQDEFHRAGGKFKRRMVRSGNRFGKSTMGCAENCAWLLGERLWHAPTDPIRRVGIPQHPVKLLTITTDWDKVDEIFTSQRGSSGKVWKFLPPGALKERNPVRRNHSGAIDTIELRRGSLWRFDTVKSFLSNPQGSESSDWDAIHVDEPCPEAMWKACSRGLVDRSGSAWFTLTPLSEAWIDDMFFPSQTGNAIRDNVWAVTGTTYDNPYLSPEAIKEFESSLTEDERQCRIHGLPLHLAGLVYKEFSWNRHVLQDLPPGWSAYNDPPREYSIFYAIDPHPQTPHAVLFCAVSPTGKRFYYDDLFIHCSVAELSKQIHERLKGRNVVWGKIDPIAYINDPITETNMAYEFERCGIYVEKATKALAQGILHCKGELQHSTALYFTPACRRTLWEIQRYCWDTKDNKPIDRDDHMMENFYRLELSEMRYIDATRTGGFPIEDIAITRLEIDAYNKEEEVTYGSI